MVFYLTSHPLQMGMIYITALEVLSSKWYLYVLLFASTETKNVQCHDCMASWDIQGDLVLRDANVLRPAVSYWNTSAAKIKNHTARAFSAHQHDFVRDTEMWIGHRPVTYNKAKKTDTDQFKYMTCATSLISN